MKPLRCQMVIVTEPNVILLEAKEVVFNTKRMILAHRGPSKTDFKEQGGKEDKRSMEVERVDSYHICNN